MKKFIAAFFLLFLFFSNNYSKAAGGWLGIHMVTLDQKTLEGFKLPQNTPKNVLIRGVMKNSAADLANLLPGDVILEINNQTIKNIKNLHDTLNKFFAGEDIKIKIFRENSEKLIKVKLGKRPSDQNFEFVEGSEKFITFDLGMAFVATRNIIYTKYFPKEILDKYQSDGLIVACIDKGSFAERIGIQLRDQIILIDGKKTEDYIEPPVSVPIVQGTRLPAINTTKPIELTIKRDNQIFNKTIIPTPQPYIPWDSKCTPEFSDVGCMTKFILAPSSDTRDDFWVKVFECCKKNNVPVVPFHNRLLVSNKFNSLRLTSLGFAINYYRYEKPEGYISKLKEYVNIAREDLKEMDKFLKLYPEVGEPKNYTELMQSVRIATSVNTGQVFKSIQEETLQASKEDIERLKKSVLNKIETLGINNAETLDFLYLNYFSLKRAKEFEFILENWSKTRKKVSWSVSEMGSRKELSNHFYKIYGQLINISLAMKNINLALEIVEEGMKISKNNYKNLEFKLSYGKFLYEDTLINLLFTTNFEIVDNNYYLIKSHLDHLENLSKEEEQKLFEMDNFYMLDVIMMAGMIDTFANKSGDRATYTLKGIKYINENESRIKKNKFQSKGYNPTKALLFNQLIQAAFIDDNLENFQIGMNEIKTFISESSGDVNKLWSILNATPNLLQIFFQKGFYSEMETLIKFVYDSVDVEEWRNSQVVKANFTLFNYYVGYMEKKRGNIDKAILIHKESMNYNNITPDIDLSKLDAARLFMLTLTLPELYELYYLTGRKKEFNELNYLFFRKNINDLSKKDFVDARQLLAYAFKVYKTILKYHLDNNNNKQFLKLSKFLDKEIVKVFNQPDALKTSNRQDLYQDIAEIAKILARGGELKKGKKIFDFLYPYIMSYYNDQLYHSIWRPNFGDNFLGNVYLESTEYFKNDRTFQQKAYAIAQVGKNTNTSRDLVKSAIKGDFKSGDEQLIKEYHNLQQKLLVLFRSKQFKPKEAINSVQLDKKINTEYKKVQEKLLQVEKLIKKQNPEYFEFLKIRTADIKDLQQLLNDDQAILDYFFSDSKIHVVVIKKNSFKIYNIDSNYNYLTKLTKQIRATLVPVNRKIIPFEVNKSFELNESIFLFLKDELKSTNKLIIVPDGPLNSLPLHVLATKSEKNCLDCRTVKFNLNDYAFSYLPTAETLVNMDNYEEKFDFIKSAKFKVNVENVTEGIKEIGKSKTGEELLNKIIKKGKKQKTKDKNELQIIEGQSVYLGVGDPNLYLASQEKIADIDYFSKVTKLRSIFRGGIIEGDKIKKLYPPVDGSSEEIKTVANYLKPLKSTILLGDDANETNLKKMEMNQFKIIHFATHGEISGALEGLNEPFLVLTPPDEASEANDGLLTMTEIMALNTNADLVVLSACNTAAGDMPGTEGFSGLAKSFFISGSKSILVSNWYVETLSAQELVINLFKNIKEHPELTVSENFKSTMIEQLGKHKDKSHPLFWAPFIIVGKDNKFSFNL